VLELNNELSERLLSSYPSYPSFEKVDVLHGYLYILKDSVFPGYVKLGMTRNLQRRYKEYNQHKPFNTAEFTIISEVFNDVVHVEKKMLEILTKKIQPIGARLEWFESEHIDLLVQAIKDAEGHFNLYIPFR